MARKKEGQPPDLGGSDSRLTAEERLVTAIFGKKAAPPEEELKVRTTPEYLAREEARQREVDVRFVELVRESIDEILSPLDSVEKLVVVQRFGLDDGYPKLQREVAVALNRSRSTAARIEYRALSKLRQSGRKRTLREVLAEFEGHRVTAQTIPTPKLP